MIPELGLMASFLPLCLSVLQGVLPLWAPNLGDAWIALARPAAQTSFWRCSPPFWLWPGVFLQQRLFGAVCIPELQCPVANAVPAERGLGWPRRFLAPVGIHAGRMGRGGASFLARWMRPWWLASSACWAWS